MTAAPGWFATEVLKRLSGVRPGKELGQFYARCPAHEDKRASLGIRAGDSMPLIYHCHAVPGCEQSDIRTALANLGVPEEHLGQLGTPQYEQRRKIRGTSEDRRELEAARRELAAAREEMAELRNGIRALIQTEMSPAMLKVRILATVENVDVPAPRKEYVPFAVRAGVSQPRAYEAWKVDPLGGAKEECQTLDHVVLTQPAENCQAPQVTGRDRIIGTRKPFSERESPGMEAEPENSRNDNSRNEKSGSSVTQAIKNINQGDLGGKLIA